MIELEKIAEQINGYKEKIILIYAFNGTGKTRLSTAYKDITKEEEKHLKIQVYDVFKILGVGVPFMLIPGASIIIPFILKVAEKNGIDLYPSNFKSKDKSNSKSK